MRRGFEDKQIREALKVGKYPNDEIEFKKKQLKKERRRNKIKKRLIVFAFLFVCVGIIVTVLKAPFFNIKSVICVGYETLTEQEILETAKVEMGVNIFSSNISAMKRRVAAIPEVSMSNVRRLFPNKIKIWVRECKKAAYVKSGNIGLVIDPNGKILGYINDFSNESEIDVAQLTGINSISEQEGDYIASPDDIKAKKIYECMNILDRLEMLDGVTAIDASDLSDIKIEYQNRLEIFLGSYENMEYKLTFISKVIKENISEFEHAKLDLRGENLYVGPRDEEPVEPENTEETEETVQDEEKTESEE